MVSVLEAAGVVQWDDLGDLVAPANGMAAHAMSKRQLALATVHMAARLCGGVVDVVAAQPGFTASRFYDKVCALYFYVRSLLRVVLMTLPRLPHNLN